MSKLVILDGPDRCGKSTLAAELAVRGFLPIHAMGERQLHSHMMDYHMRIGIAARHLLFRGIDVVLDRFWPSELVYGEVLRPQLQSRYDSKVVSKSVEDLDPIYIMCSSTKSMEMQMQRSPEEYTGSQFSAIHADFRALTQRMMLVRDVFPHVHEYQLECDGSDIPKFLLEVGL